MRQSFLRNYTGSLAFRQINVIIHMRRLDYANQLRALYITVDGGGAHLVLGQSCRGI
jgi:hypothetical protein